MPISVTDSLSNQNEHIEAAAKTLGGSEIRHKVFDQIYFGKRKVKTVSELASKTNLSRKQVLTAGKKLADNHIVEQIKENGETAYKKIDFFHRKKNEIIKLANNPKKLAKYPTKRKTNTSTSQVTTITINNSNADVNQINLDEIDSFKKTRDIAPSGFLDEGLSESKFKEGVIKIIKEDGEFTDWGGEKNDLYTTRLYVSGKRFPAAFAFKGPGTKGKLVPGKMGKNGDQIQRLFEVDAKIFIVQYWNQIDESVLEQMRSLAIAKSVLTKNKIYYGVIDGIDSNRLVRAYPDYF